MARSRSCRAMKSSVSWSRLVATSPPIHPGIESGFRGSDGRAARASSAKPAARICARKHATPAINSTAAMRNTPPPTLRSVFQFPRRCDDVHAAPLLCAGLIGYRAYRLTGPALRLGIYGFGAAAHIIAQVARSQGRNVFAFVTPGDHQALGFARDVGVSRGPGSRISRRPVRSTQRSSSPRLAPSCPKRCHASLPVGSLCAPAST